MSPLYVLPSVLLANEVWNLMRFDSFADSQNDTNLQPTSLIGGPQIDYGGVNRPGVTVIQFGSQSSGYWVMVTCPLTDPTSWDTHTMLTFLIGERFLYKVNSVYIQDLENLTVSGYFSNGLPLP